MNRNICIIYNGTIRSIDQVILSLKNHLNSHKNTFLKTEYIKHAEELALKNSPLCDVIISVGGDGTLNEIINGVMACEKDIRPIITLLPYGTGNDFARTVGISKSIKNLAQNIQTFSPRFIDLGKIEFSDKTNSVKKRYFVNIGDVGIGGHVAERLTTSKTRFLSANIAYFKATILAFLRSKPSELSVNMDHFSWSGKALSICFANGKYFASGLCISPESEIDDGKLNGIIMGKVSIFDYLREIRRIKKGRKFSHGDVFYTTFKTCKITSGNSKTPLEIDGEFAGFTPAQIDVIPKFIKFLY